MIRVIALLFLFAALLQTGAHGQGAIPVRPEICAVAFHPDTQTLTISYSSDTYCPDLGDPRTIGSIADFKSRLERLDSETVKHQTVKQIDRRCLIIVSWTTSGLPFPARQVVCPKPNPEGGDGV